MAVRRVTVGDVIVALSLCALAVILAVIPRITREDGTVAILRHDGERIEYDLSVDTIDELIFGEHRLTVTVAEGKIAITESNCRDQICVGTGAISSGGEAIVCLPAGVSIRISGDEGGADFVVG